MDKKSLSKSKGLPKQNGEKFQRFRSKIKKTLSKTMGRSFSTPRSRNNKIFGSDTKNLNNRLELKSNESSRSSTPDRYLISKMSRSTISNDNHERIELKNLSTNHKSHCFMSQRTNEKFTFCDVCNGEVVPMGSVFACHYCQIVLHESCCGRIDVECQYNRQSVINNVIEWDKLMKPDVNSQATNQSENSQVKLRKKAASTDTSPTGSEYHTCKTSLPTYDDGSRFSFNFYHGGVETMQCRESLISVTSISSMSSLITNLSYDFTTLDRDSIKAYGIQVNPINQRATASLDDSLTDVSSVNSSTSSSCSIQSSDHEHYCRPCFIYHEQSRDIVRVDWTPEELYQRMMIFNQNNYGLTSEMKSDNGVQCLLGTVRVYINLLRPVRMELAPRPSSIFDVVGSKENEELTAGNAKIETLWLPRGTGRRLFVNQSTTTSEVINGLLKKFHIKANPKKFGLYEHTIEGERRLSARKLADAECPLTTLLMWTDEGVDKLNEIMSVKRLVLQENETGDIEWTGFSIPELRNFLIILEKEEKENSTKITLKYSILKKEILRLQSILN